MGKTRDGINIHSNGFMETPPPVVDPRVGNAGSAHPAPVLCKVFLESRPPYRITNDLEEVQSFMRRADVVVIADQLAEAAEISA
jgi:hypothetical protein